MRLMSSATLIAKNCQPVWISGGHMIFNRQDLEKKPKLWGTYSGDPNGSSVALLGAQSGHRGASSVTPDGSLVVLEVAEGVDKTWPDAAPGKGSGNDLFLLNRGTGLVTRLTTGRRGTIWACIKPDGSKVCWSEMVKTPLESRTLLGFWQIHVADIVAGALANEKVWDQGPGFYETYGWRGDSDQVMFCSNATISASWLSSQCWMIDEGLKGPAVRVSRQVGTPPGDAYHEFMARPPDAMFGESQILTSVGYQTAGMDLHRIRPDGTGMARVSWFGMGVKTPAGWPKARPYADVLGVAFDPADPKSIYAGVTYDPNATTVDCWRIEL